MPRASFSDAVAEARPMYDDLQRSASFAFPAPVSPDSGSSSGYGHHTFVKSETDEIPSDDRVLSRVGPTQAGVEPPFAVPVVIRRTVRPTIQACRHCHQRKRKCDRKQPSCTNCLRSKKHCIFDVKLSEKAAPEYIASLQAEAESSRRRIQALESLTETLSTHCSGISTIPTEELARLRFAISASGQVQAPQPSSVTSSPSLPISFLTPPAVSSSSSSSHQHDLSQAPRITPGAFDHPSLYRNIISIDRGPALRSRQRSNIPDSLGEGVAVPQLMLADGKWRALKGDSGGATVLPPYETAKALAMAFFTSCNVPYPFLQQDEITEMLKEAYHPYADRLRDPESCRLHSLTLFRVFLILAIGTCHAEQCKLAPSGTSLLFFERAMENSKAVLMVEDLSCVQTLLLLGIYALYDNEGPSVWSIVGLAVRMAIGLGLHKKLDSSGAELQDEAILDTRRRVFWALYNLDRLVAFTMARPQGIHDEDIDIELPSLTSDRSAAGLTARLLMHSWVRVRRLGGVIQRALYRHGQAALTIQEATAFVPNMRKQVEDWSEETKRMIDETAGNLGRLQPSFVHPSWIDLTSHILLMALYRPSSGYPYMNRDRFAILRSESIRAVTLFRDLIHSHRIAYNLVYLMQVFTACTTLLYCLVEMDGEPANMSSRVWREDTVKLVGVCLDLLDTFKAGWPGTDAYREQFINLSAKLVENCESANEAEEQVTMARNSTELDALGMRMSEEMPVGLNTFEFDWTVFDIAGFP